MQKASTPDEYVQWVSSERRQQFAEMRQAIQQAMPNGFEERMSYGMIGYVVPHELYPPGYHCNPQLPLPFVSIANQKNFFGFYHMGLYADAHLMEWFLAKHSSLNLRKLDMGKSCIRFKKLNEVPLELLTELVSKMSIEDWIACYEKNLKR